MEFLDASERRTLFQLSSLGICLGGILMDNWGISYHITEEKPAEMSLMSGPLDLWGSRGNFAY